MPFICATSSVRQCQPYRIIIFFLNKSKPIHKPKDTNIEVNRCACIYGHNLCLAIRCVKTWPFSKSCSKLNNSMLRSTVCMANARWFPAAKYVRLRSAANTSLHLCRTLYVYLVSTFRSGKTRCPTSWPYWLDSAVGLTNYLMQTTPTNRSMSFRFFGRITPRKVMQLSTRRICRIWTLSPTTPVDL